MKPKFTSLQNELNDDIENMLAIQVINSEEVMSKQDGKENKTSKAYRNQMKRAETVKIEQILWSLIRKIYLKMYQGLEGLSLSLTPQHLQSLNTYLRYPDKEIRKLVLLIITTRMKFEKKFRRAWISQFPGSNQNKKLVLSNLKSKKQKFILSSFKESLDYNQGTLFYFMKEDMSVYQFEEYQLGQVIVKKTLEGVPEIQDNFVWFDRSVNRLISKNIIPKKISDKEKKLEKQKEAEKKNSNSRMVISMIDFQKNEGQSSNSTCSKDSRSREIASIQRLNTPSGFKRKEITSIMEIRNLSNSPKKLRRKEGVTTASISRVRGGDSSPTPGRQRNRNLMNDKKYTSSNSKFLPKKPQINLSPKRARSNFRVNKRSVEPNRPTIRSREPINRYISLKTQSTSKWGLSKSKGFQDDDDDNTPKNDNKSQSHKTNLRGVFKPSFMVKKRQDQNKG